MALILKKHRSPHEVELHEKLREEAEIKRRMTEDGYKPPATRRITVPTKATQHALIPNKDWKKYREQHAREGVSDDKLLERFHKDTDIYEGEKARKAPLVFGPSTGDIKMGIRGTEDYELDQFVVPHTGFKGRGGGVGWIGVRETHPEGFEKIKFSYEDYKRARKNALLQEGLSEDEYLYESTDQEKTDDLTRNYLERDLFFRMHSGWVNDVERLPEERRGLIKELKEHSLLWDKAQGLSHPFVWEEEDDE